MEEYYGGDPVQQLRRGEAGECNMSKRKQERSIHLVHSADRLQIPEDGRILELGCNVGRNLRYLIWENSREFIGLDVCKTALELASLAPVPNPALGISSMVRMEDRGQFHHMDLLTNPGFLDRYHDDYFDMGVSCWFLTHLPHGPAKDQLVHGLLRTCQTGVIIEPYAPAGEELMSAVAEGLYTTFEDYRTYDSRIQPTADGIIGTQNLTKMIRDEVAYQF
jgi:SAM-dependent methyltransferase